MLNSLLKRALGLERTVIEGARIEGDSIIVSVRPRRAAPRCPVCGRRCAAYDRLGPRRWRAPDLGAARCYLEHPPSGPAARSTACAPRPSPGRGAPRAGSPRPSRTGSRGSRCTCAAAPWPSWRASTGTPSGASARASRRRWRRPTGAAGSTGFAGSASTRRATRRARGT